MKRLNNKKNLSISIILLLVLIIGLGYAYLTSNLSISGTTEIANNSWDIHFENLNVTTGSVTATTPAAIDSNETSIEYAITLSRPKDFYEFTVDVVNDGTLPGKISISELSGLDTNSSKVIDYTINYTNGNPVNVGDIMNAGTSKHVRVRVFYKDNISVFDLPSTNLHLDLTYTLQFLQSDKDDNSIGNLLQNLSSSNSCILKYEGQVTDRVGIIEQATNVYFDNCKDKRNIIFGGFCWQAIRTTETGGLKMIYNGEPVDGKCISTREDHLGIVGDDGGGVGLDSEYIYGGSFTYDNTNNTFTLLDTIRETWSELTSYNIKGKFTCLSNEYTTCSTLYQINSYATSNRAYGSKYTITNTNYAQIGKSPFNADGNELSLVGYMYNVVYPYNGIQLETTNKFSSSFTYDSTTNIYSLSGTTQNIGNLTNNDISNTHYTCWNSYGTCENIAFVYYTAGNIGYNARIKGGKDVEGALKEMLYDDEVNRYNSSVKGIIDNWYREELLLKADLIEDTVYCNSRNITDYGGWNPNGGGLRSILFFKNDLTSTTSLNCNYITDQFALNNNKAKLTYPVALITNEEFNNMGLSTNSNELRKTGSTYLTLSPYSYYQISSNIVTVSSFGSAQQGSTDDSYGVRPAISLASFNNISSGTGSETDPWIVD